jgi:hypothetical protein
MTSYRDELDWAYHGEVYGEAMFAAMADVTEDPTRAAELNVMALVERQTKEQLAPLCDREGIERDDAIHEARGRKLADRAARPGWDWDRFLHSFEPLTDQALLRYRSMRDVLAPKDDAATMRSLVVHEEVLQRYAQQALAGEERPSAPLLDALEGEHRRTAEQLLRDAVADQEGSTATP